MSKNLVKGILLGLSLATPLFNVVEAADYALGSVTETIKYSLSGTDTITAAAGVDYVNNGTDGNPARITLQGTSSLNFANDSKVTIQTNSYRGIFFDGGTGNFAGETNIDIVGVGGSSRVIHVNGSNNVNFASSSVTNLKISKSYGLTITNSGQVNISGEMNITQATDGLYGIAVGLIEGASGSVLNVNGGKVNVERNNSASSGAFVSLGNNIIVDENSSFKITSAPGVGGSGLELYRGGSFVSKGEVEITVPDGNAIFVSNVGAGANFGANVVIDGATYGKDIKITGNILQERSTQTNTVTISMNTTNSSFVGDSINQANANNNTNLLFAGSSEWTGNNVSSNGNTVIQLSDSAIKTGTVSGDQISGGETTVTLNDFAKYDSNVTITNGINKIEGFGNSKLISVINVAGGNNSLSMTNFAEFNGVLNVTNGINTSIFDVESKMLGNIEVAGGISQIQFTDTANQTGVIRASVATSTVDFLSAATLNGNIDSSDGLVNFTDTASQTGFITASGGTVNFANTATLTGDIASTDGVVNFTDTASQTGNITATGGTVNFLASSDLDGKVAATGAASIVNFANTATLTGDIASTDGVVNFTDTASQTGNITATGGTVNFLASSDLDGKVAATGAASIVNFANTATLTGGIDSTDGVVNFTDDASQTGDITASGGTANFKTRSKLTGNIDTSSGISVVNFDDDSLFTGNANATGGTAEITLMDQSKWNGDASASSSGIVYIDMKDDAIWTGSSTTGGSGGVYAKLSNNARWRMLTDSAIHTLQLNDDSKVILASNFETMTVNPRTYETLTIENLDGTGGSFILDTWFEKAVAGNVNDFSDKLVVNGTSTGTFFVQVADESLYTGVQSTDQTRKLLLITDESGANYQFVGKDLNQGGLWVVKAPDLVQEGNKWYLYQYKQEANPDTKVLLSGRESTYRTWTRNDTLRQRLGDLRYNDSEAGIWGRYFGGNLSSDASTASYRGFQVGADKTNGNTTYGIAMERSSASANYGDGNGKDTETAGIIYVTNYSDTGSYVDFVAKYGKIASDINSYGAYPDTSDFDSKAYSLSIEYGKTLKYDKGYFVEPQAQLTYGHISSVDYTTARNTTISEEAVKSVIGRLGVVAGRKVNENSDYYMKLSYLKEFAASRNAHLSAANGENMYESGDYKDGWFELGLGTNVKIGKNTHFYGDVERSFGANITKKWQINAGARWEF